MDRGELLAYEVTYDELARMTNKLPHAVTYKGFSRVYTFKTCTIYEQKKEDGTTILLKQDEP